ncbi:MAG: hypothetical protein QHI38_08460 [Armatimonadota bacterium]|nr:hypothetical protein [Armatimonadota bacterium]
MADSVKSTTPLAEGKQPLETSNSSQVKSAITLRSIILGLVATVLVDLWVHYAELVLGGARGHTAIVNTSIPVGPFDVLVGLVVINLVITRLAPRWRMSQAELLTVYVMSAVSGVLSSSGGLHFLIPTITAAHYFAAADNRWAELFHRFIPDWIAQTDPEALKAFYRDNAPFEIARWAKHIAVWSGFLVVFASATLCLSLILKKQWVDSEHLPFPTVQLPIELAKEETPLLRDPLFFLGAGLTFAIVCWNTLAMNVPSVPALSMRGIELGQYLTTPPWNAVGKFRVAFFPFAIGIGYLLSTEVVFSVWFFYLFSKAQAVFGAAMGWTEAGAADVQNMFPYLIYQGAGAFLGLAIASIWISRRHLARVFRTALSFAVDSDPENRENRIAVFGLIACFLAMVAFTVAAGASKLVAVVFVTLVLVFLIAATRIRAETGNPWPVGPEVDAFRLMITFAGSSAFSTADLTALTYVRAATAGQDFRGVCMPHELDGLKIADATGMKPFKLAGAMLLAVGFGVVVSFIMALMIWTDMGALARGESWRGMAGKRSFDTLAAWMSVPVKPNAGGMAGIAAGLLFAMFLAYMRTLYVWWPFHPVGYCMSNTFTSYNLWTPCLIAWLVKVAVTRAGGMRLYRRMLPFFFGLIAGDFIGGGITTLIGCLTSINVYPVNW